MWGGDTDTVSGVRGCRERKGRKGKYAGKGDWRSICNGAGVLRSFLFLYIFFLKSKTIFRHLKISCLGSSIPR